jgi:hypothetical protein
MAELLEIAEKECIHLANISHSSMRVKAIAKEHGLNVK